MTRIAPLTLDRASAEAQTALQGIQKGLGFLPNAFATLAHSPAALKGYLALAQALGRSGLSAQEREVVALAASAVNGCDYCLAAHEFFGGKTGLTAAELAAAEAGTLSAVARLAREVTEQRGQLRDEQLQAARAAGLDDARIVEVVAQVSLLTLTNYLNNLARTEVDFPPVA